MKVLNDLLWNSNLKIYQDPESFMFSLDSLLLAKFVKINKNTKCVLDIGTGNAPIPIILANNYNLRITGVEIQESSYFLAVESIRYNNLESKINLINDNINNIYKSLENNSYDLVTCNPPFYKNNMVHSNNKEKNIARNEIFLSLDDVFKVSKKVLKNKGRVAIINRPERLVEIITLMKKYGIEPKKIQFVYPKLGGNANHVLIEGMKNGNSGIIILKPMIIHNEDNTYTNEAIKIFD